MTQETETKTLSAEQMQQNRDQALQLAQSLQNVDADATLAPLSGAKAFAVALRMAANLSQSALVPKAFRGNPEDIVIAMDIAHRTNMGLFAVLQSLYIVHGKPGFSASFLVACLNATGRFGPIGYEETGEGDNRGCVAYATDLKSGEVRKGARITIGMAKAEKWHDRDGSKWKTMPEQMLRYRAATFFVRAYAPDVALGLPTSDELQDIGEVTLSAPPPPSKPEDFGVTSRSEKASRKAKADASAEPAHDAEFSDAGKASAPPPAATKRDTVVVDGATVDRATGEVLSDPKADPVDRARAAQAELDQARAAEEASAKARADAAAKQRAQAEAEARAAAEREQLAAAEQRQQQAKAAPSGDPLTDGMRNMVSRKLDAAGGTWPELEQRLGAQVTKANINDAFAIIETWGSAT